HTAHRGARAPAAAACRGGATGGLGANGARAAEARAFAFVTLVSANCALILSSRSMRAGIAAALRAVSRTALWVIGGTLVALAVITMLAPVAAAFSFAALGPLRWLAAAALGVAALPLFEAVKALARATRTS
ncbi:MAG: cation transporting ATPase C-terminal domain-containing protein, partial [Ignavibacteria bacterium]